MDAMVVLEKSMRIIARFEKGEAVRFVSHLDIQRTFQRAFRRANIPLAYSQGFNPHPLLSFATALSLGYTSEAEWFDVKLAQDMCSDAFRDAVNAVLPGGFRILEAAAAAEGLSALTALMAAASYTIRFFPENPSFAEGIEQALYSMIQAPVYVEKRTKGGIKTVDIRPLLLDFKFSRSADNDSLSLSLFGVADAKGSLNVDLLLGALASRCSCAFSYRVHRTAIYSADGVVMPALPQDIKDFRKN